jgi:hypothetical protein
MLYIYIIIIIPENHRKSLAAQGQSPAGSPLTAKAQESELRRGVIAQNVPDNQRYHGKTIGKP